MTARSVEGSTAVETSTQTHSCPAGVREKGRLDKSRSEAEVRDLELLFSELSDVVTTRRLPVHLRERMCGGAAKVLHAGTDGVLDAHGGKR